jgi:hypothetical protein
MLTRGASRAQIDLAAQIELSSLQSAVTNAIRDGIQYDKLIVSDSYELIFAAPRAADFLPVLKHALRKG